MSWPRRCERSHDPAVVGEIAHAEYGLIKPGERSVVVLPATSRSRLRPAANPLANNPIPSSDLLPSDAILDPGARRHAAAERARAGLLAPRALQPGVLALAVLTARPERRSGLRPGGGGTIVSRPVTDRSDASEPR